MRFGARQAALALMALLLAGVLPAGSQAVDCVGWRQRIDAAERSSRAGRYAHAARLQQEQIDRLLGQSRASGCGQQSDFFEDSSRTRCGAIEDRLQQMSANLQALREAAARTQEVDAGQRSELINRYESYCGNGEGAATPRRRNGYNEETVDLDAGGPEPGYRRMPLERDDGGAAGSATGGAADDPADAAPKEPPVEDGAVAATLGGPKAVCVKTCDGSFYPVSFSASAKTLPALEALCHAGCPNAETKLYTYSVQTEIDSAVDKEGRAYSELSNAKRYEKVFDRTCTCRAPAKSWLETLVEAERLYAGDKTDVVVTQAMSDALGLAPVHEAKAHSSVSIARKTGARKARSLDTVSAAATGEAAAALPPARTSDATTEVQLKPTRPRKRRARIDPDLGERLD